MNNHTKPWGKWNILGAELFLFTLVFGLTLVDVRSQELLLPVSTAPVQNTLFEFLSIFAAATLLLLVMLRSLKGRRVFGIVFALAIFSGIGSFALHLFGPAWAIILTSVAILAYYQEPPVWAFDLILVVGMVGVAANLGTTMAPVTAVILLAILAIYDIIAVYGTKHMIEMGQKLLQKKVFFAMILTDQLKGYTKRLSFVAPGKGYYFLGTGDVVLPALLVAAVGVHSVWGAVITSLGALFGLSLTHYLFVRKSKLRPMPALPPIALGATLGYIIALYV